MMNFLLPLAVTCALLMGGTLAQAQMHTLEFPEDPNGFNGHIPDTGTHTGGTDACTVTSCPSVAGGTHTGGAFPAGIVAAGGTHSGGPDSCIVFSCPSVVGGTHTGGGEDPVLCGAGATCASIAGGTHFGQVTGFSLEAVPSYARWASRVDGPASGIDQSSRSVMSPDGTRLFVTGESDGIATGRDYLTVAYDTNDGSVLWARRYDGSASAHDIPRAVTLGPDASRVYVFGSSDTQGDSSHFELVTVAYDANTGSVLWTRRYTSPFEETELPQVVVAGDARVYVIARGRGFSPDDYLTIAYDAATGDVLWSRRYGNDQMVSSHWPWAAVTDGAQVYVTGYSQGANSSLGYLTIAYDGLDGDIAWVRRFDGDALPRSQDWARSIAVDNAGVYVTGISQNHLLTIAYGKTVGGVSWTRRYASPTGTDLAFSVRTDGNRVYVSGQNQAAPRRNHMVTIAYAAQTGTVEWTRRYAGHEGPGSSFLTGLDSSLHVSGSRVYVTGERASPVDINTTDIVTIAYDSATGSVEWARRYDGPGVSSDSGYSVFSNGTTTMVTGRSRGVGANIMDILTIAYPATPADGIVGAAGGTVTDTAGTGASFSVGPGVLPGDTTVFIQRVLNPFLPPPPPPGFFPPETWFVSIELGPNPSPLPPPGATITLPLVVPGNPPPGSTLDLFKYDPSTQVFTDLGIIGTVNPAGTHVVFNGVTEFSTFVGLRSERGSDDEDEDEDDDGDEDEDDQKDNDDDKKEKEEKKKKKGKNKGKKKRKE